DSLVESITSAIDAETWSELGGPGSMNVLWTGKNTVLIISQTRRTHDKVASLLSELRKLRKGQSAKANNLADSTASAESKPDGAKRVFPSSPAELRAV